MATIVDGAGACADAVLRRVGRRVVLGMPLGIGKPILFANELYARAARDPSVELTIVTALSLSRPRGGSELERRFLGPLAQRLFGDGPELEYVRAQQENALPPNVRVIEFYFEPGTRLDSPRAQQDYLCANYTHVAREVMARGVNVLAHLVATRAGTRGPRDAGGLELSLGSNPDVTADLLPLLDAARGAGREILLVGEVHARMPFMLDRALVDPARFDYLIEDRRGGYELFCPPNPRLSTVDHAIGLHASSLVRDGGTLQVGIGELGDALVYALLLRHRQNAAYRAALERLQPAGPALEDAGLGGGPVEIGGREPFRAGLFASTEMFVDQLLDLIRAGVLTRRAYDDLESQRAADAGADVPGGCVLHAGFFLGPRRFYAALREMPEDERALLGMRGVGSINQLYGPDHELRVLQRRHARFVNTTMMVTLLGAAVSDGLADGRVVSGVGGQYNFVSMAHALPGGRSILCLRSTRAKRGRLTSNVLWSYGHATIPRHLRDVVVTEYGVADLRGRTDAETIAALLAVADSRFQEGLLAQAKAAGKIRPDHRIPEAFRDNTPGRLERCFAEHRRAGRFEEYPFGTDLTPEEIALSKALEHLRDGTAHLPGRLRAAAAALRSGRATEPQSACLQRLQLDPPRTLRERLLRRLVLAALVATGT